VFAEAAERKMREGHRADGRKKIKEKVSDAPDSKQTQYLEEALQY